MSTDRNIPELNIAPFALPNCTPGELRFEEPRDISRVVVTFDSDFSGEVKFSYQRNTWPERRMEKDYRGVDNALTFGWGAIDDWFNTPWHEAAVIIRPISARSVEITFNGLSAEIPESTDYDVTFRRTNGIKVDSAAGVESIEVYTRWEPVVSMLEVRLDCGKKTDTDCLDVSGYNAVIENVDIKSYASDRLLEVQVRYVKPDLEYAFDYGILTFALDNDKFSISLRSLQEQGPIWYEEEGIFIKWADDPTSFEDYLKSIEGKKTLSEDVAATYDQGLGGSMFGQPRAHPTAQSIGCKYARQRFWVEYNGDIVLTKWNMHWAKMSDTPRYKNEGDGRIFFLLERCRSMGRFSDPAPVLAQNDHFHKDGIVIKQKSFAVPLIKNIAEPLVADDTIIAMLRFKFRNESLVPAVAEMPIEYSSKSERSNNRWAYSHWHNWSTDHLVPKSQREKLTVSKNADAPSLALAVNDQEVIRFALDTGMQIVETEKGLLLRKMLEPGESCEALVKAPYIALDTKDEIKALDSLAFDKSYKELKEFWISEAAKGAQLHTPEARLDDIYRTHVAHIMSADVSMNDDPYLVNTSVGSSTYGNFTNESVMIMQELDERGLHEEVRRRLSVYLKYQGQIGLKGNFTDHDGVFFAAGGFEHGDSYSQHHGWALWHFAEHYFMTKDDKWLSEIADQLIKGMEWVFRQRRNTMTKLPHSRGWEYGFIPAASLEDVTDYFYWLTPNTVSWTGVDRLAAALEAINHPEAKRLRKEADDFKADLIRGYENARQHSPIVRLRNGKWVPHYPSRLYLRGRDVGWIREILEGSVYLMIMGLYDPNSKQGKWILDDFQDNRYLSNNYGYPIPNVKECWFDFGGFSCQPSLLPGLIPHLDRDEPELYIWMYFNAFAATYREETNVMVEHPHPILGHSNSAWVKTSDMANSMKWLRYMFVYAPHDELYIGRAIPREWLTSTKPIGVTKAATKLGDVSAIYTANPSAGSILLEAELDIREAPNKIIARFRHPESLPIKCVKVNGKEWTRFDPEKGDVDITGLSGKVVIEACY